MSKEELEFPEGLIVKAPHEKAPDFVKAQISIKVPELGQWLRDQYKAGNTEWVNIDVKVAKSGKWYAAVNTYKPKEKEAAKPVPKSAGDIEDDLPF